MQISSCQQFQPLDDAPSDVNISEENDSDENIEGGESDAAMTSEDDQHELW